MLSLNGLVLAAVSSATVLARPQDPNEWVGPGLLGFVVLASLGVATVLLWRNMNKQLRKVTFEEQPEQRTSDERRPGSHDPDRPDHGSGGTGPADTGRELGGDQGPGDAGR